MRLRDRSGGRPEEDPTPAPAPAGIQRYRAEGESMLAAGDDAIDKALSGDSQAFLESNRQQGGE